jgi:enediyne biosynthesis protein E4
VTRRRTVVAAAVVGVAAVAVTAVVAGTLLLTGGGVTPTTALGAPRFVDETATAGIDTSYDGPIVYATGGGLATLDCDEDGRPDLYVAGGAGPAALYRNTSPTGGALRFARIADASTDLTGVLGAYPLDVDGDGHADLAVLRAGETVLLRGLGGCRFERANEAWGFDGGTNADTTAFSATWEGANAFPTFALGRYLKLDAQGDQTLDCDTSLLVRPAASGTGYGAATELAPGYCPLSMLFSDWDGSGRRDLRVTNDRNYYRDGTDQLWRIAPGEAPHAYTTDEGWIPLQVSGMGIGEADLSSSGYPDYVITSQGDNKVQALKAGSAQPSYRDIAKRLGVTAAQPSSGGETLPSTAWHPAVVDVNDDGFADLLLTKGNVSAEPGFAAKDPSDLFLGQPTGPWVQAAEEAGIVDFARGRGASVADFNLDGLPDLVEVFYGAPVKAWRNVGSGDASTPKAMGHWLQLRLSQLAPNADAIGAWVEVKVGETTLRREVTVGGGHASGALGWLHFGLGPSTKAQVRVQWPDGTWGPWADVAADGFYDIERGTAAPRAWTPPAT